MAFMRGIKFTQFWILTCLIFLQSGLWAQEIAQTPKNNQKWLLGGIQAGFWAGSFYTLNKAWYANYPRSKFHFYNDWKEWQQMDKAGHSWSAYQLSRLSSGLWRAAGSNQKSSAWIGSLTSMGYMGVIEILDGYSDKWGFSGYDVLSNSIGASAFLFQELAWKQQRISLKLSYSPVRYGALRGRANDLFGSSDPEKILKDYNGQTYWASINLRSFFPQTRLPKWLGLSLGYGAKTMLGGYENVWTDALGNEIVRHDIPRYKRMYLSFDVDLSRIPIRNKFIKTIFSMANVLKMPAPALELNTKGGVRFHPLFY